MRYLISLSFAMELDEGELPDFISQMDEGIYQGIKAQLDKSALTADDLDNGYIEALIDWYGVSVTPRRTVASAAR